MIARSIIVWFLVGFSTVVNSVNAENKQIRINHRTGANELNPLLILNRGDQVTIEISNTKRGCFLYNAESIEDLPAAAGPVPAAAPSESVRMVQPYDGKMTAIRVTVTKKSNATNCPDLLNIDRRFEIIKNEWSLDFSGAAIVDELVDPVYFLEPGMQTIGTQATNGFFVRQNRSSENDVSTGFAILAHLYHTESLGNDTYRWAPLSFGFGVGDNSDAKFLFGTSLKFGDRLYLTAGQVWGDVEQLPSNLQVNGFTEDANALTTLPKRNDGRWFIGLSYRFGNLNTSSFSQPFEQSPKPE